MKKIAICLVFSLFSWLAVAGEVQLHAEIDHLIKTIENSNCAFIRNGRAHSAEEAVGHILKKYEHFKDKIKTTEDFIDYCASKSMLSDQPYQIGCQGEDVVESKIWFLKELERFRNN